MKSFQSFIEESKSKRCPSGKYWCFTSKKCKNIPSGYYVGRGGYLEKDNDEVPNETNTNGNGGESGGNGGGE